MSKLLSPSSAYYLKELVPGFKKLLSNIVGPTLYPNLSLKNPVLGSLYTPTANGLGIFGCDVLDKALSKKPAPGIPDATPQRVLMAGPTNCLTGSINRLYRLNNP